MSGPRFSRRQFVTGAAAVTLASVLVGRTEPGEELLAAIGAEGEPAGAAEPRKKGIPPEVFTFSVTRPEDLVLLDFSFYGFSEATVDNVVSLVPSAGNVILVQFPPQAISEAAYSYVTDLWLVDPPPVLSMMSGPSRLCFTVSTSENITFPTMTVADLLDWSNWTLLVPANAQVGGSGPQKPSDPTIGVKNKDASEMVTSIEYPAALFLSPTAYVGRPILGFDTTFTGRTVPLVGTDNGNGPISECWTAALSQNSTFGDTQIVPQVAAVWARDFTPGGGADATPEIRLITSEHAVRSPLSP